MSHRLGRWFSILRRSAVLRRAKGRTLPRKMSFCFCSRRYTPTMRHLVDIGDHAEKEVIQ
jgi:hypothetical protein